MRRLTGDPRARVRLGTTLEAIEDDRLLVGHDGRREWLPVRGPVVVSQGIVPRAVDLGPGGWRTVVLDPAADAAEAIRQGTAVRF